MASLRVGIAERILTFVLCVCIYYPFFLFGMLMIYVVRLKLAFKKFTGFGYKEFGKLGHISRKYKVHDVVDVSTNEEISFLTHRSPSYLYRMSVWTAREHQRQFSASNVRQGSTTSSIGTNNLSLAKEHLTVNSNGLKFKLSKWILRGQNVELISEQDLAYSMLFSVFAHSVTWDESNQMFKMKMTGFDDFFLFRGFYWDAREIWVNKECTKMKIVFNHGREISWPCVEDERAEWRLAKLHAQVCMTYYAPGLSHNHVHFVFPSSFILIAKRYLKPSSFLYRLLEPHWSFTERINYQVCEEELGLESQDRSGNQDINAKFLWSSSALHMGINPMYVFDHPVIFRKGLGSLFTVHLPLFYTTSLILAAGVSNIATAKCLQPRHFFFWQPIPLTVEQFVEGVAKKCYKYYYDDYKKHEEKKAKDPNIPIHCNFPPAYVLDKKLQEIPYLYFLASYYSVIRKFVASVFSYIDPGECEMMMGILETYVPGIEKADMVDVISTFIHQVGVVHYCDHETFLRFFGREYGCMCIRTPYEPWSNVYHWDVVVGDDKRVKQAKEYKDNPLLLLHKRDIMRTRCFQNVFVDFISDWSLDLRLATTEYKIISDKEKNALLCIEQFKKNLMELDSTFAQIKPPVIIPPSITEDFNLNFSFQGIAGEGENGRAANMQLIPLSNMVRAVCF